MRFLLSILFAFSAMAAEIPVVMVPTISALTNLTPSPLRAAVAVIPSSGQWSLWRFSGSSEAAVDNVNVLPSSIGVGRWLNAPNEWLSSNGGYGTNLYLQGITFISLLNSDKVTLSYDGLTNPDSDASPISYVNRMSPLVVNDITALLATTSTPIGRRAYLRTNSVTGNYTSEWIWCPLLDDADNTNNIRRPTDRTAVELGRWQSVPVDSSLVASLSGSASNLTLTGTNNLVDASSLMLLDYSMSGAPAQTAVRKDYVDFNSPLVVDNLAALLATETSPRYRIAVVLNDTSSDGAAGDWYLNPSSTASASSVVKIPDDRSSVTLGRWFKR